MPSTYTLNNGIELIGTGEQSGTWGDTTNTNLSLIDTALDGQVTVTLASAGSSGSPNTLPVSDGAASDGRNRMVIFNDGGDLGATAYVQLTPNDAEKIIYVRNDLSGSRSIILFQGTYNASNDYEVPAGTTAVVYFDGGGTGAVAANVFNNAHFDALNVVGTANIDSLVATTADINGGTIDGTVIGGTTPAAISGTTGTFSGDLTVDTDTLFVDVSTDRVGIGTSSPSALLDVAGDAEINELTVGRGAGDIDTNTVLGLQALESNTTGNRNVGVGGEALESNTTGVTNTAVGYQALQANTTGNTHTAVGYQALLTNTTGASNTAVGYQALQTNTTGANNTAVGLQAMDSNTTGFNNTAVGREALQANTTGSRNTVLGYRCDPSAADGNDQVVVGYNLTGKGTDTAFIGGTNGAYNEKNVTTWETTSDQRIKKNIADNNDGLNVLSQVRVRNFEYRAPDEITELPSHAAVEQDGTQIGVIAQELQQVLPECVSENSTGVLSVNTDPLVWYLINAVKELKAEIEELKGN